MKCPVLMEKVDVDAGRAVRQDCMGEVCTWWDEGGSYCCIVDIASSLSMVMHALQSILENGIPQRGGK